MPVAKFDHSRAELLATVEQSPAAAGARDRAGWVGLFTADGTVEDPVGSRPHRGAAAVSRFYDTFIGPRDIVSVAAASATSSGCSTPRALATSLRPGDCSPPPRW